MCVCVCVVAVVVCVGGAGGGRGGSLLYFSLICNSETVWIIFMKLHRRLKHNIKTMCREQRRQFLPIRFPGHNSTLFARPSVRAYLRATKTLCPGRMEHIHATSQVT